MRECGPARGGKTRVARIQSALRAIQDDSAGSPGEERLLMRIRFKGVMMCCRG